MGALEQKKAEKRQALLDAAYALFLERGAAKTSVSDITTQAKVAKGTFYLYFQDKDAVLKALLGRISYRLLAEGFHYVEGLPGLSFTEKTVQLVDYLIEYFRPERLVLRLMERSFALPTLAEFQAAANETPLLATLRDTIRTSAELADCTEDDIFRRMSAIIGMCMSVCYSAIMEGKPDTIDNMKPALYEIIRRAL
ncbi:MAG: TetR/AcrR family transcriptional regulator [Gemmiger sp.]|nr:TetR/AcrR family transcriptional regulator [Gemmiger sp.]